MCGANPEQGCNEKQEDIEVNSVQEKIMEAAELENVTISTEELLKLQTAAAEYRDKHLRGLADAENARKRLQKERQEISRFAIRDLVLDLLQPIDLLDKALSSAEKHEGEVKMWAQGFHMLLGQMISVLANYNVKSFESMGKAFDAHQHEAVEMIETDAFPEGTVIEECVKGYKMGDMVLRPARVKVAKAPVASVEPEASK